MAPIHPVTIFRTQHGLSTSGFALKAGVDRSSLCRVETGSRNRLSVDANLKIEEFTKGAVTLHQLTAWRWPKPRRTRTLRPAASGGKP